MCNQFYDRRRPECAECPDAYRCQNKGICKCYGSYSKAAKACGSCINAAYCRNTREEKFHNGQHGKPSIILADVECVSEEKPEEISRIGEIMIRLFESCNHNPLTIAIAIARYAGMSYSAIGRVFGMSRQLVQQRITNINNRNLANYLRAKHSSKYYKNIIKINMTEENNDKRYFRNEK